MIKSSAPNAHWTHENMKMIEDVVVEEEKQVPSSPTIFCGSPMIQLFSGMVSYL